MMTMMMMLALMPLTEKNDRQSAGYLLGGMGPIPWVWIKGGMEQKRKTNEI